MWKRIPGLLAALLVFVSSGQAGGLEEGLAAIASEDFDVAYETLMPLANDGNPVARHAIGGLYEKGWGVDQNFPVAVDWFRKAAEQGNTKAKASLGFMYRYGRGVELDYEEAIAWYQQAASDGDTNAQLALAVMIDRGLGAPQSSEEALRREEARQFHDMDAWIAAVEVPGGGLMVKHDMQKGTQEPSDSVRGFVVFRRGGHFFALMCEVNLIGFFTGGRTYDPENWDAFLTDLSEFYLNMEFGSS